MLKLFLDPCKTPMILNTDAHSGQKQLPDESVHCICTSPPYFNLRDYKTTPIKWPYVTYSIFGFEIVVPEMSCELGQEDTPKQFIGHLLFIFRESRRVLRNDGTLWVNLGDSYATPNRNRTVEQAKRNSGLQGSTQTQTQTLVQKTKIVDGLKMKDQIGVPWMFAFAMRDDGWILRQEILWAKPNVMPESVNDRCTKSHEYIFMFAKNGTKNLCWRAKDFNTWTWSKPDLNEIMTSGKKRWEAHHYYYDAESIKTEAKESSIARATQDTANQIGGVVPGKNNGNMKAVLKGLQDGQANIRKARDKQRGHNRRHAGFNDKWDNMTTKEQMSFKANKRSVWTVSPAQYADDHFAAFPEELIADIVKAGCPVGGVVLDPFFGRGTTGSVARKLNRNFIGIELSEKNIVLAEKYLHDQLGMFN